MIDVEEFCFVMFCNSYFFVKLMYLVLNILMGSVHALFSLVLMAERMKV